MTLTDHAHETSCAAPNSDCSNIFATSIAIDTDSFQLNKKKKKISNLGLFIEILHDAIKS
jgi:hypothetical protein